MKTHVVSTLLCLAGAALSARADDTLPAKSLERLKAATVYVKVESDSYMAAGSGFVFHVQDRAVYLATNQHVVMVPGQELSRPHLPPLRLPPRVGKVTVVFGSGTRKERALPATVVFRDPAHDLALLKVDGDKDLPEPIAIPKTSQLKETMPAYVLGFPFGEKLAPHGEKPTVTIGKGAISSLREDKQGELARIQIEAEVHPGNSGGPVVDAAGQLIGVTVTKVPGSRIAMVIPATHLGELMRGRFVEVGLYPKRLRSGESAVCFNLLLFDPLKRVRSARVSWRPSDAAGAAAAAGGGEVATVKGSRSLTLERGETTWQGYVRLPTSEEGQAALPFQVVLSRQEGEPQVSPVFTYRWVPNPKVSARKPLAEGELARLAADLKLPGEVYRPRRAAMERLVAAEPSAPRQEALELIRKGLGDPDVYLRESSARALGIWAGKDGLGDLVRRMKEEDFPWVRWTLLEELSKLPGDESARAIAKSLSRDHSSGFPAKALRTLGATAEAQVLPLLEQPDAALRLEACHVLETIGTKQSIPVLEVAAIRESDPQVVAAARAALKTIKDRK
jgi:hypothetical protein